MSTHSTPPQRADQTGQEAAELARRAARFDERGIALQTVIIMVVLLAIAGAIAAVLFSRAGDVTSELESADITATKIDSEQECVRYKMNGKAGEWDGTNTCTWTDTDNTSDEVTATTCSLVEGSLSGGDGDSDKRVCTLTV